MEFGSIGLGVPPQQTSVNQNTAAPLPQGATLSTNPQNVVTPTAQSGGSENDLRRNSDGRSNIGKFLPRGYNRAAEDLQPTSQRTTLNFDPEQNRIFLEVIDKTTNKVIERIPSETLLALIEKVAKPPREPSSQQQQQNNNAQRTDTSA